RRFGVGNLHHLSLADNMRFKRAAPMLVRGRHEQLTALPLFILLRGFFQLEHQMLALHQKAAELLAVFFLLQLFNVVAVHACAMRACGASPSIDCATASAILMPSTPAERMPPA